MNLRELDRCATQITIFHQPSRRARRRLVPLHVHGILVGYIQRSDVPKVFREAVFAAHEHSARTP